MRDSEAKGYDRLAYPALPASIPAARSAAVELARRAGCSDHQVEAVRLAVSEGVTNAVRHAYPEEPGEVRLTLGAAANEVIVLIEDDGCGPHVPARTPGLGWGWKLMAQASESFTVGRGAQGGTRALLRFRCPPDAALRA